MIIIDRKPNNLKATSNPFDGAVASTLPRIDGSGLTTAEWFKVNGRANQVKADVASDMPEVTDSELHAIGQRAAADALREVLRDRAPAPCCDSLEERPCMGCSSHALPARIVAVGEVLPSVVSSIDPWDVEYDDPSQWPDDTDDDVWATDDEPVLGLIDLVELQAMRFRSLDNGFGDLVGERLERLAREVYATSATCPDMVDARLSVLDHGYTAHALAWEPELNSAGVFA